MKSCNLPQLFFDSCKTRICSEPSNSNNKKNFNSLIRKSATLTYIILHFVRSFHEAAKTMSIILISLRNILKLEQRQNQKVHELFFLMIYFCVILDNSSFSLPKCLVECQSVRFSFNFNLSSPTFTDASFWISGCSCVTNNNANANAKGLGGKLFYFYVIASLFRKVQGG